MNKFNKIFSIFACLVIVLLSSISLTACSKEEVKENTETVIETTTSILPVEYSKSLAQGILANACATSINEKSIKCDYLKESYTFAGFKADSDVSNSTVYLDENGKITERMEMKSNGVTVLMAYAISVKQSDNSYKYYSLQNIGNSKLYNEIVRNTYDSFGRRNNTSASSAFGGKMHLSSLIIKSTDDGQVEVESMLDHVIGGRYFDGKTYINASYNYDGAWGSEYSEKKAFDIEYVIENNRISSIRILSREEKYSKGADGISNTDDDVFDSSWNVVETFKYEYTNQAITDAPTSIDGYELNENAATTIIK